MAMVIVLATAAMPVALAAHDGHVHTVRGTVLQMNDKQLEIRGEDGKPVTIAITAKTSVLRGTKKADRSSVEVGQRVVVDIGNGKAPLVARSIKLGAAPARK
jgi:hypothetical protein